MGLDIQMAQRPETTPPGFTCQYENQPEYFRVNSGAIPLFIALVSTSGVLVEEEPPKFPQRPPSGLSKERLDEIENQDSGGEKLSKPLNPSEAKAWSTYKKALDQALSARSKTKGKVPSYKLKSSDGWYLSPDECLLISKAMRKLFLELTQEQFDKINLPFEIERKEMAAYYMAKQGFVPIGVDGPPISLKEIKEWIAQFSAYNELAASYGGYYVR